MDRKSARRTVVRHERSNAKSQSQPAGDQINNPLVRPSEIQIEGGGVSQFPLSKVELIHARNVVATGELDESKTKARINTPSHFNRTGWLAFRATGPAHPDHPTGGQYAHTSPIYVEVANKPADSREDALYFLNGSTAST